MTMKTNCYNQLCIGVLALGLAITPAFAKDGVDGKAITKTLSSVPALELPPKAATLVKQAPAVQAEATTREVVRAAIKMNESATVPVVGAIASANTEMAPVAAGTAAGIKPKLAVAIAKAAAAGAPSQAAKIVLAVCQVVPRQSDSVASAVALIVPSARKEILEAAFLASSSQPNTELLAAKDGTLPPPVVGPPFAPLGGTPGEINSGDNSEAPPGSRDYSAP